MRIILSNPSVTPVVMKMITRGVRCAVHIHVLTVPGKQTPPNPRSYCCVIHRRQCCLFAEASWIVLSARIVRRRILPPVPNGCRCGFRGGVAGHSPFARFTDAKFKSKSEPNSSSAIKSRSFNNCADGLRIKKVDQRLAARIAIRRARTGEGIRV